MIIPYLIKVLIILIERKTIYYFFNNEYSKIIDFNVLVQKLADSSQIISTTNGSYRPLLCTKKIINNT
jgi:hypothetical protein